MSRAYAKTHYRVAPDLSAWFTPGTAAVLLALSLVFGVGYIIQISATSSKGDQIRSLESLVGELKTQKEKLELQVASGQSVQEVSKKVQDLGLVATTHVEYVTASSPSVAKR